MLKGSLEEDITLDTASATASFPGRENLENVKTKWKSQEDYALAYRLQEEEFVDHYDKNRSERRQMGGDTRLGRCEQGLEDEYWEQVRRDREREDEEVARKIQAELLERERREAEQIKAQQELADREVARRLLEKEDAAETRRRLAKETLMADDARLCADLHTRMHVGDKHEARRQRVRHTPPPSTSIGESRHAKCDSSPVVLPSGMSPEHNAAVQNALNEEDEHLARYMQDKEMAKFLQKKQIAKVKHRHQERPRVEVVQSKNHTVPEEAAAHEYAVLEPRAERIASLDLIQFDDEPLPNMRSPQNEPVMPASSAEEPPTVSRARAARQNAERMGIRVLPNPF